MKSYDVNDHGACEQSKKPWVTPVLEIIALESAEHGSVIKTNDGPGMSNQRKS